MAEAVAEKEPDNNSGKRSLAADGSVTVAAPPTAASGAECIHLPVWSKALGWFGAAGLIYLLICAVSIISRGFAGLGADAAHSMFAFAAHPWVGLFVGVLGTVLIQSSTTTTAIAVTAVGAGVLPIHGAIPRPKNQIVTSKLRGLGMTFGGEPLLEETVRRMVEAA